MDEKTLSELLESKYIKSKLTSILSEWVYKKYLTLWKTFSILISVVLLIFSGLVSYIFSNFDNSMGSSIDKLSNNLTELHTNVAKLQISIAKLESTPYYVYSKNQKGEVKIVKINN